MGYSKLDYSEYVDNQDYWSGTKHISLPKWAEEISQYGIPISAIDFYDSIFQEGDLEQHRLPEDYVSGEYGAIALEVEDKTKDGIKVRDARRITVTDGVEELIKLIDTSENFCMIAPVSYAGKNRSNKNARFLHALCIEIDNIEPKHGIDELFYVFRREHMPLPYPTFIVCSGNGLHVYWNFVRPIPLFKNIFEQLKEIKTYMTKLLWDKQISNSWQHVQYESLCQAFRCVGTSGKNKSKIAMAFRVGDNLTIEKFNERLPENLRLNVIYKSNLTREKAKELYPEWYQRRVVEGAPKGHYNRHEGIYYDWLEKIMQTSEVGHRYNRLEHLCALAVQCQIPPEQVEADCRRVAEHMESLTNSDDNHFTEYDVLCALRTYHLAEDSAYHRKLDYIEQKCAIRLPRNKRNGRKQVQHCEVMRAIQNITNPDWRDGNGRPDKRSIVIQWQNEHPDGKKADCIRDTGLSKPTVLKWWDSLPF